MTEAIQRKPQWLRNKTKNNGSPLEVKKMLHQLGLNTVCDEAMCPNRGECFGKKRAAFMMLGKICTRNCTFCNVASGIPEPPDPDEPHRIAAAIKAMGMRHVVITSVTRDDLKDGGAGHFAEVVRAIKETDAGIRIEVLIPDFQGDPTALKKVIGAKPHIINHNLETVSGLYSSVRPQAIYQRSLDLLKQVKKTDDTIYTKSGLMLGLGETKPQVLEVMKDLKAAGCDFLTIGQYLQPSRKHHPVIEYIHPDIFETYRITGLEMGFKFVAAAPFVRSSYNAEEAFAALS
jgi:lipoic acid synthetase